VVPDGYFVLRTPTGLFRHFLEVDRSSVTGQYTQLGRRDFARKIRVYIEYHRSGAYEKRDGGKGLRVLTITTSEARLSNLKRITEDAAGGRSRFWFTTMAEVTPATVLTAPMWRVAGRNDLHSLIQ
jgi:hypothetical protein